MPAISNSSDVLKSGSHLPKSWLYLLQLKALKMKKNMLFVTCFIFFSCWWYLNFCPDSFGHEDKRFDKKAHVNFKIFDVTEWETNNYTA